jgi:hypothetical protein
MKCIYGHEVVPEGEEEDEGDKDEQEGSSSDSDDGGKIESP